MSALIETYAARAAQARADAASALLVNVQDRCLRAAAAWTDMATRAQRTENMRLTLLADKVLATEAALA
jgi:hypothetical protein